MATDSFSEKRIQEQNLELDPKRTTGLVRRAQAYNECRRWSEAAEDATKALAIKPQLVNAYTVRARARNQAGNRKGAIADLDQALNLKPTKWLYKDRGWLRFTEGAWADAASDFRKYTPPPKDETLAAALWIFVSRVRAGEPAQAKEELIKGFEFGNQDPSDFYRAVFRYLTGEMTEDKLLSASESSSSDVARHRLCVAQFYIGNVKAAAGRIGGAIAAYERCLETKQSGLGEYVAAGADLERLKKAK